MDRIEQVERLRGRYKMDDREAERKKQYMFKQYMVWRRGG